MRQACQLTHFDRVVTGVPRNLLLEAVWLELQAAGHSTV